MKKMEITKDDIEFLKRALMDIKYHMDNYAMYERERKQVARTLDEQMKVQGISYDSIGTCCTRITPYVDELIITEASYAQMKRNELKKVREIRKHEHLKERYAVLSNKEIEILTDYIFNKKTLDIIAEEHNNRSRQWASDKVNEIFRKMMEVEIL